jgi:hypothetical protein
MLKELKEKYDHVIKSSSHMWANGNFSFYRLGIFITSYKGQKRIWNFFWKVVRYIFRKIFGIKPDRTPDYDLWMKQWFPGKETIESYKVRSKICIPTQNQHPASGIQSSGRIFPHGC